MSNTINANYANGMTKRYRNSSNAIGNSEGGFANALNNASVNKPMKVYMKTDDVLYSGGCGTGLSFYLKYAEDSTEENPIVVAKGVDENGQEFEKKIKVNEIDLSNASLVEMRAFESHYKISKGNGLSSFPPVRMKLNERIDVMELFDKTIKDMCILRQFDKVSFYRKNFELYKEILAFRNK